MAFTGNGSQRRPDERSGEHIGAGIQAEDESPATQESLPHHQRSQLPSQDRSTPSTKLHPSFNPGFDVRNDLSALHIEGVIRPALCNPS
jgi:hypothetical protein